MIFFNFVLYSNHNSMKAYTKLMALIALFIAAAAAVTKGQNKASLETMLNATDPVTITVDTSQNVQGVRKIRDHWVNFTYKNVPLSISLSDAQNLSGIEHWSTVDYSDNLDSLGYEHTGNLIFTNNLVPDSLAETDYSITYRANDTANAPHGVVRTVSDEFDRYWTEMKVTYMSNGQQFELEFMAPNSVVKQVFDWDPSQPIPFYPSFGLDAITQPSDFEDAMETLKDIIDNDPELSSRLTNRNTPAPCPDPNPWYADAQLLSALGVDPLVQDELYPQLINVYMVDFSKSGSALSVPAPEYESSTLESGLKSTDSITFSPPMPDKTIPSGMSNAPNKDWGWAHEYIVTVGSANETPEIQVFGGSPNIDYDTIVKPTGNPLEYSVHVILKTGSNPSIENLTVDFQAIHVGIDDFVEAEPEFALDQNYPNPFNAGTNISYDLNRQSDVSVSVYDINGRLVKNVFEGAQGPGEHNIYWNGMNDAGKDVASGVYFLRLDDGSSQQVIKLMKSE